MSDFAWQQREDETARAYAAFVMYRDMGVQERSIRDVAQKLDKSATIIGRWSSQHQWVERAEAWDEFQQSQLDRQREEARRQLIDDELADYKMLLVRWREIQAGVKLRGKPLEKTLENGQVIKFTEMNPGEWMTVAKLRSEISNIGRRALGLPEKITQSQLTGDDGGNVGLDLHVDDLSDILRELAAWDEARRNEG